MTPMYEQLGSNRICEVIEVMNHLKLRVATNLEQSIADYNKYFFVHKMNRIYVEAKDNAKFLSTLERYA